MKLSILLASYNGENFLPPQLASLSGQSDPDFEVIWQDDGSLDHTVQLLKDWSLRDPRFRPGKDQGKHLGAIANFISLLGQAAGDYAMFCDQDDVWESEKSAALLAACRKAEQAASPSLPILVHSDASLIDENGTTIAPSFFRMQGWDPSAVSLNQLLVQNNATGCMMLLNRPLINLVLAHGDPSRMFMHDWFTALSAAAFGKVIFLDQPLTRYRQHESNVIGASHSSLLRRGWNALGERDKAKERIRLTYSHARAFQEAYGDLLPPESLQTVTAYLATENLSKFRRLREIRRLGCLMQSPVTRLGQYFFG